MYDALADPYGYGGTLVLKNIPDIRDQAGWAVPHCPPEQGFKYVLLP
jgi:hypothetical protein